MKMSETTKLIIVLVIGIGYLLYRIGCKPYHYHYNNTKTSTNITVPISNYH